MSAVWFVITTVIGGAILGGIAQLLIPGKARIPVWATVLAGIVGAAAGSFIYYKIFGVADNFKGNPDAGWDNTTKGIDWWRHLWQVGAAVVAVMLAGGAFGMANRNKM
jgi:uncharacterized membrane protein YeaQ/YmgE (transglycosylase-associated protein family)